MELTIEDNNHWRIEVRSFLKKKIRKEIQYSALYCTSFFIGETIKSFINFEFIDPKLMRRTTLHITVRF